MSARPSSLIHPLEGERRLNSAMIPDGLLTIAPRSEGFGARSCSSSLCLCAMISSRISLIFGYELSSTKCLNAAIAFPLSSDSRAIPIDSSILMLGSMIAIPQAALARMTFF